MLRWLWCVVAVTWLAHANLALAQSDPGRDAEARGLFEAGRAAFDQGRYPDALGYFDRAYQLSKRPQLLYNIGQVHDRLRHDEEALQAFQQYLRQVPGAENRTEVEHRIDALRQAMFGTLHFTLTPSSAQVWIDGEAKTLDNTGRIQITTGSHEILVRAVGHSELRQRMNVRGGDMIELPITLQPSDDVPAITPATIVTAPTTQPAPAPVEPAPQIAPPSPSAPAPPSVVEAPAPAQPPPTQGTVQWQGDSGGSSATTWGVVSAVGAVLFIGGGTAAWMVGSSKFDDLNDECRGTCSRAEITDRGADLDKYALMANVGLIGGGVLAGLSVILFVAGSGGSEQPPAQPALVIGPGSILAQGSF